MSNTKASKKAEISSVLHAVKTATGESSQRDFFETLCEAYGIPAFENDTTHAPELWDSLIDCAELVLKIEKNETRAGEFIHGLMLLTAASFEDSLSPDKKLANLFKAFSEVAGLESGITQNRRNELIQSYPSFVN